MKILNELEKKLEIDFKNKLVLKKAFIHRSYLNEAKQKLESNERLEFLGDSILSYIVSNYLFQHYPKLSEGNLTNLRSSIVKTKTLAQISKRLKLGDYLYLSRGEEEGNGRINPSLLADTFEALIGAIYIDQGIKAVEIFLQKELFPQLKKIIKEKTYKDAKSDFQELVQEDTKISPLYRVLKEEGPDHAKQFTVGAYVENKLWGKGKGKNKQEAERAAAKAGLEKWKRRRYNT